MFFNSFDDKLFLPDFVILISEPTQDCSIQTIFCNSGFE